MLIKVNETQKNISTDQLTEVIYGLLEIIATIHSDVFSVLLLDEGLQVAFIMLAAA